MLCLKSTHSKRRADLCITARYTFKSLDLLEWFLAHGALPNAGPSPYLTALSSVVYAGSIPMIERLFAAGGDVERGHLLSWALQRQHDAPEVLRMLLERSADVNGIDYDGHRPPGRMLARGLGTPLHQAAWDGQEELARILLEYGAEKDVQDSTGKYPIDLAEAAGHEHMVISLYGLPRIVLIRCA